MDSTSSKKYEVILIDNRMKNPIVSVDRYSTRGDGNFPVGDVYIELSGCLCTQTKVKV